MSERAYAAVAYIRVSTGEQRESGVGVTLRQNVAAGELARVEDAGASGKTLKGRPGLLGALAAVEEGSADVLLAPSSTRLSKRSLVDFAGLMQHTYSPGA